MSNCLEPCFFDRSYIRGGKLHPDNFIPAEQYPGQRPLNLPCHRQRCPDQQLMSGFPQTSHAQHRPTQTPQRRVSLEVSSSQCQLSGSISCNHREPPQPMGLDHHFGSLPGRSPQGPSGEVSSCVVARATSSPIEAPGGQVCPFEQGEICTVERIDGLFFAPKIAPEPWAALSGVHGGIRHVNIKPSSLKSAVLGST